MLELREELFRAEAELNSLKKRWTSQEKKGDQLPFEAFRSPVLPSEEEAGSNRRSADMERRKLLQQNQTPATPSRRRVLRGGHTRTLSLLSPATAIDCSLEATDLATNQATRPTRTRNPMVGTRERGMRLYR